MSRAEHEERFLADPAEGRNYHLIQVDGHQTTTARRWRGSQTSEGPGQDGGVGRVGGEERESEAKSRKTDRKKRRCSVYADLIKAPI